MNRRFLKFLNDAEQILVRVQLALSGEGPRPNGVPEEDLHYISERITAMMKQVRSGRVPAKETRYPQLARLILDQWPLGDKLGAAITELERAYLDLD